MIVYNLRRTQWCTAETVDEMFRRSIRNEADRHWRTTEHSDRRQNSLTQRRWNYVNLQFQVNISEHSCGNMTMWAIFIMHFTWKVNLVIIKIYLMRPDGKLSQQNLTETPNLFKKLLCENSPEYKLPAVYFWVQCC